MSTGSLSSSTSRYLDPSALSGLESMRFSTRHRIDGSFSGRHVARRQGGAGQYIDSREYAPGDDLRRLDWPAMGRTGRAYIRLYQDETNLSCLLTIDASGSMHFGAKSRLDDSGSKLEWAKYFSTALAYLIATGRDQVGLSIVNQPDAFVLPGSSPRHLQLLYGRIAAIVGRGRTDLNQSLDDTMMRIRRRGVLMIISDFLVEPLEEVLRRVRQFRSRGWEPIAVHVVHPDEETLPQGIAFRFGGMEGEGWVNCRPGEIRRLYQERFEHHCTNVRDGLLGAGCDYRRFRTDGSYLDAVRQFLLPRRG